MAPETQSPVAASAAQLAAYVAYLRDLGIYDLYRREPAGFPISAAVRDELLRASACVEAGSSTAAASPVPEAKQSARPPSRGVPTSGAPASLLGGSRAPRRSDAPMSPPQASPTMPRAAGGPRSSQPAEMTYFDVEPPSPSLPPELAAPMPKPVPFDELAPLGQLVPAAERAAALQSVRADIGDCTRCPLAYAGRHTIVFADGDPNARLMFVGEGPGADEDASGVPFVGKAGQLLNNMITAMGTGREDVYIANIVKCRPPGNRTPEFVEATTCSQFLLRQIDIVRPQVIVALGATAATYLLGVRQSLASLRGKWHSSRGARVLVTYHPAYLLRDPRQKGEAWKDLQMAMAELGMTGTAKKS